MSARKKFVVWLIEERGGPWVEQGDGELSGQTAERIAREIRPQCVAVRVLPAGVMPPPSAGERARDRQEVTP